MGSARLVLVALAVQGQLGCAEGLPPQVAEAAYAEARAARAACRPGDVTCCAGQVTAARAAGDRGESARAAHLWQEVALACPGRRAEATAAVQSPAGPPAEKGAGPAEPAAELLNVTYRTRLSPAVRLYWVGTSVGARLLPRLESSMGPEALEVEVQAIRFTGSKPGPLLVVDRRLDVVRPPHAPITIEISEAPAGSPEPLAVSAHVGPAPVASAPGPRPAPSKPRPAPRLEPARALYLAPARAPLEFGALSRGPGPALWLCLDREGEVDSVRFLEALHPRLAASLVDMLRDSRHEPYRVNDLAVPSCQLFHAGAAEARVAAGETR